MSGQASVVAAVAIGGGAGAAARYAAGVGWPTGGADLPWPTLAINAVGSGLIGVLLVLIVEVRDTHRLVQPFLATGVLGGFTTFSAYAADVQRLVDQGNALLGWIYLVLTPALALASVWLAAAATRAAVGRGAG